LGDLIRVGGEHGEVVEVFGKYVEHILLSSSSFTEEEDQDLVVFHGFFELREALNLLGLLLKLLLDPFNNSILVTTTLELNSLAIDEQLKRWVAVNTVLSCSLVVDSGVEISEDDWGLGFLTEVEVGSSDEMGLHLLAMTAPRGKEFHEDVLIVIKNLLEVVISEDGNAFLVLYFRGDGRSDQ